MSFGSKIIYIQLACLTSRYEFLTIVNANYRNNIQIFTCLSVQGIIQSSQVFKQTRRFTLQPFAVSIQHMIPGSLIINDGKDVSDAIKGLARILQGSKAYMTVPQMN